MKLTIRAFEAGGMVNAPGQSTEGQSAQQGRRQIFGGELNLAKDPVAQRRKEAQQAAWNVVKNAWENDKSVDEQVRARREHCAQMERLSQEAADALAYLNDNKAALKELYGIADDSGEQRDLKLLEKEQDYKNKVTYEPLTMEEQKELEKIHKKPLTEYQARALELNDQAANWKRQMREYDRQMRDDVGDIRGIERERLKHNPMLEAQEAAKEIQKAANEEVIGMLMQESKDHVDEKQEEDEEKADAAREEQKVREEMQQQIELKRAVQEALIEGTKEAVDRARAKAKEARTPDIDMEKIIDMTAGNSMAEDVGQSLAEIKNSMKLVEADLKGIKVDEEV